MDLPVSRILFALLLARRRGLLLVAAEEDAGYVLVGLELFDEPRNHRLCRNIDVRSDQTGISSTHSPSRIKPPTRQSVIPQSLI